MPVVVLLRTDDPARAVPYPILALEDKRLWVAWTATEWGVAVSAGVFGTALAFGLLWLIFADLFVAAVAALFAGLLLAVLARYLLAPHLDVDRPVSYLRRLALNELRLWWWTRGPVDRGAAVASVVAGWIAGCVGLAFLPGRLSTVAAIGVAAFATALVVKRFESDRRRELRWVEHARRSCSPDRLWASRVEPREVTSTVTGNCQVTRHGVYAWFVLGELGWWFGSDEDRVSTVRHAAAGWARRAGSEFVLRVAYRPAQAGRWARQLDEETTSPLPAGEGWSWSEDLEATQVRMKSLSDWVVMLAIRVGDTDSTGRITDAVREAEGQLTHKLAKEAGFRARRAEAPEVSWLLHRDLAPGHHPDLEGELPVLDLLRWETVPFGRSVKVVYRGYEQHAVVLTLTHETAELDLESGRAPWLACLDSVEDQDQPIRDAVSVHIVGEIVGKGDMRKDATDVKRRVDDIISHHDDSGVALPPAIERAAPHATQILDEVTNGTADQASRAKCVVRLVVTGATAEEARRRAEVVRDHYSDELGMWFAVQYGAGTVLAETISGEHRFERSAMDRAARSHPGYQRWMPVTYLAAGAPTAAATVGTPSGPYWGYGTMSRKPFLNDLHYPMEQLNKSGVVLISGEPGSGKSVAIGNAHGDGIERGCWCTGIDPSGQLQRLAESRRYRGVSRVLSISRARPGTLNPMLLVPDPQRGWFDSDEEWVDALAGARADRIGLTVDTLLGLLSRSTAQQDGTEDALRLAARKVVDSTRNPRDLFEALREDGVVRLAELLEDEAIGRGRLVFPAPGVEVVPAVADEQFVVITLPGLQLPDAAAAPSSWTGGERWAMAKFSLSVHYASLRIYEAPAADPKILSFDEAYVFNRSGGRAFVTRTNRDSRKVDCAVLEADQHPFGLADFDNEATIGSIFAFRQTSRTVARKALEQLQIPTGAGYEEILADLADGEALHRDCFGNHGLVQIDLEHRPERMRALNTTPGRNVA
jgi:hypothetical protein